MDNEKIKALHAAYCEASGMPLVLSPKRRFAWDNWIAHGSQATPPWDVDQLRGVIQFLHTEIRAGDRATGGRRTAAALRFAYLVEDPEWFEQELQLARKAYLVQQRLAKKPKFAADEASVRRATGRPDAPPDPAPRSVAQIIDDPGRQSRLAEHIAALKAAAGMPQVPHPGPSSPPPEQ